MKKTSLGAFAATAVLTLTVALPSQSLAAIEPYPAVTEAVEASEHAGSPIQTEPFIAESFELLNHERDLAGLTPMSLDPELSEAANARVAELETTFSHKRVDGTDFSHILKNSNISYTSAGEIIAAGQKTPSAVLSSWMGSAPHRAQILNTTHSKVGIGHRKSSSGTDYWVMIFITE